MFRLLRRAAQNVLALVLMLTLVACAQHLMNSEDAAVPAKPGGAVRIASYNVHYIWLNQATGDWSVGDWDRRKGPMADALTAMKADIIAFQEMESFSRGSDGSTNLTLDYLLETNPGYAAAAVGDWRDFPSTQPIFYRRDAYELDDQGWFFFSDTPDVIYSRTFNGSYPAFASWARFRPRGGGRPFTVMNVHFEYKSRSNRLQSAELVNRRIAPMIATGDPVFLVGDLNARAGARTQEILTETGITFADIPGSTYHFNRGLNLFGAIDHLGYTGARLESGPLVLQRQFRGEWPSDHYPVFADFILP